MANQISIGDYVRLKYISGILPIKTGKCLDIGCGPGNYKALVESKGYQWVGIDAVKHEGAILARAESLPFNEEEFDVALLIEVLEHVFDFKQILAEARRVLKTDGILIIHTPNKLQHHILVNPEENPCHVRPGFTVDELRLILCDFGFLIDHMIRTFNRYEALAWDLGYCLSNNIPFEIGKIINLTGQEFEPYGLLFRCRK